MSDDLIQLVEKNDFKQFKKVIENEPAITLLQRQESLRKFRMEDTKKGRPLETDEERMKRHARFMEAQRLLTEEVAKRNQREKEALLKSKQDWAKEEVPKQLPNIRYVYGHLAEMLRSGIINCDAIGNQWLTPTSTIIGVITNSGRKIDIDLLRLIHPDHWKSILESRYTVHIFPVENVPAIKNKKPTSLWRKDEGFEKEKLIQPVFQPTYLAIRKV